MKKKAVKRYAKKLITDGVFGSVEAKIRKAQEAAVAKLKDGVNVAIDKIVQATAFIGEVIGKLAVNAVEFVKKHPIIFGFILLRLGVVGKALALVSSLIKQLIGGVGSFAVKQKKLIASSPFETIGPNAL